MRYAQRVAAPVDGKDAAPGAYSVLSRTQTLNRGRLGP